MRFEEKKTGIKSINQGVNQWENIESVEKYRKVYKNIWKVLKVGKYKKV